MRSFALDPSTVKVDWALDAAVPWASTPAAPPGTVHVADSVVDITEAMGQVTAGVVPARPFLLMGQMTTTDPTRSPDGTESLWAYTHVPQGSLLDDGRVRALRRRRAGQDRAAGAGLRRPRVLARRVLGPRELERRNASLVGGAINGGTSQLHQQLVFRPVPGLGRAETGIAGLYLGSASAHPGGGVHGACGANAARAAVFHDRLRVLGRR